MQEHVGLGSAHPCDAKNPPAIPWFLLLLLLLLFPSSPWFFSSQSAPLLPTPSPPTLLFPSRWHIGAGGGRDAADPEEQLEGMQVAVEEGDQHTGFLTDDPERRPSVARVSKVVRWPGSEQTAAPTVDSSYREGAICSCHCSAKELSVALSILVPCASPGPPSPYQQPLIREFECSRGFTSHHRLSSGRENDN